MTPFTNQLMAQTLTLLDLPKDCLGEMVSHLDEGSKLVLARGLFNPERVGIGIAQKKAAFRNGHLAHLKMFRDWGMPIEARDVRLIEPDTLECYYWFFANVESSLTELLPNRVRPYDDIIELLNWEK